MCSVLWVVLAGIFGTMFLSQHTEDTALMRIAVWLDVANAALCFVTASLGAFRFWRERSSSSYEGEEQYGGEMDEVPS